MVWGLVRMGMGMSGEVRDGGWWVGMGMGMVGNVNE